MERELSSLCHLDFLHPPTRLGDGAALAPEEFLIPCRSFLPILFHAVKVSQFLQADALIWGFFPIFG